MTKEKLSLGSAIDTIIDVLERLEDRSRETALVAACAQLGMSNIGRQAGATGKNAEPSGAGEGAAESSATVRAASTSVMDIRSLKAAKQPTSAKQMACIVAFYLQEHAPEEDKKISVTAVDVEKYFKQAGYKLSARTGQLLIDLKSDGYMEAVGRGEYKLNAVGYNLVAHGMPAKSE